MLGLRVKVLLLTTIILSYNELRSQATFTQTTGPGGAFVSSFVVKGSDIYVGTEGAGPPGGGLYKSSDNGATWTFLEPTSSPGTIWSLATKGNYVFAGSNSGVSRSGDDGNTWTTVNNGLSGQPFAMAVIGNLIFAGTTNGVYRSSDDGDNWIQVINGLTDVGIRALGVNGTTLFAGTENQNVFRSLDNGDNWTASTNGLPAENTTSIGTRI